MASGSDVDGDKKVTGLHSNADLETYMTAWYNFKDFHCPLVFIHMSYFTSELVPAFIFHFWQNQ